MNPHHTAPTKAQVRCPALPLLHNLGLMRAQAESKSQQAAELGKAEEREKTLLARVKTCDDMIARQDARIAGDLCGG